MLEIIRLQEDAPGDWIPVEVAIEGKRSGVFYVMKPVFRKLRAKESELFAYLGRMARANLAAQQQAA